MARPVMPQRAAVTSRASTASHGSQRRGGNWGRDESSRALYIGDNEESDEYDDEWGRPLTSSRRPRTAGISGGTPAEVLGPRLSGTTMMLRQKERETHQKALTKAESMLRKELQAHEEKTLEGLRLMQGNHHKELEKARLDKEIDASNNHLLGGLYRIALRKPLYGGRTEWAVRRERHLKNRAIAKRSVKREELRKLDYENQLLLRRLRRSRSEFSQKKWNREWKLHQKRRKNLSKVSSIEELAASGLPGTQRMGGKQSSLPSMMASAAPGQQQPETLRRAQTAAAGASRRKGRRKGRKKSTTVDSRAESGGWNGGTAVVGIPEYDSRGDKHNKYTKTANYRCVFCSDYFVCVSPCLLLVVMIRNFLALCVCISSSLLIHTFTAFLR